MANLKGIINRVVGGGAAGRGRGTTGGTGGLGGTRGTTGGAGGGRSSQDEAIGRGVRTLLSRFRR